MIAKQNIGNRKSLKDINKDVVPQRGKFTDSIHQMFSSRQPVRVLNVTPDESGNQEHVESGKLVETNHNNIEYGADMYKYNINTRNVIL